MQREEEEMRRRQQEHEEETLKRAEDAARRREQQKKEAVHMHILNGVLSVPHLFTCLAISIITHSWIDHFSFYQSHLSVVKAGD
jgi:hypothetical protein